MNNSIPFHFPPLYLAALNGDISRLRELLNHGADPDSTTETGESALLVAIQNKDSDIIVELLRQKANPNAMNKNGESMLHVACYTGDLVIVRTLLQACANVDARNATGATCLHLAADMDNRELLLVLLEFSPTTSIEDNEGLSPLDYCCDESCQQLLMASENNPHAKTENAAPNIDLKSFKDEWDTKVAGLTEDMKAVRRLRREVVSALEAHKESASNIAKHRIAADLTGDPYTDPPPQQGPPAMIESWNIKESCNIKDSQIHDRRLEVQETIPAHKVSDDSSQPNNNQQQQPPSIPSGVVRMRTIASWLREIQLEHLLQNFLDNNVYDNASLLRFLRNSADWDKLLITLFGVDKFGYRQRIIAAIKDDIQGKARSELIGKYDVSLEDWLGTFECEDYTDLFEMTGFDRPDCIVALQSTQQPITEEILLMEVGINCPNDRWKILEAIESASRLMNQVGQTGGGDMSLVQHVGSPQTTQHSNSQNPQQQCNIF